MACFQQLLRISVVERSPLRLQGIKHGFEQGIYDQYLSVWSVRPTDIWACLSLDHYAKLSDMALTLIPLQSGPFQILI